MADVDFERSTAMNRFNLQVRKPIDNVCRMWVILIPNQFLNVRSVMKRRSFIFGMLCLGAVSIETWSTSSEAQWRPANMGGGCGGNFNRRRNFEAARARKKRWKKRRRTN